MNELQDQYKALITDQRNEFQSSVALLINNHKYTEARGAVVLAYTLNLITKQDIESIEAYIASKENDAALTGDTSNKDHSAEFHIYYNQLMKDHKYIKASGAVMTANALGIISDDDCFNLDEDALYSHAVECENNV